MSAHYLVKKIFRKTNTTVLCVLRNYVAEKRSRQRTDARQATILVTDAVVITDLIDFECAIDK